MAEIFFYHLTESTLDEALPMLVEKSVGRGWNATIQTGRPETRDALDGHLWTYRSETFLAHGRDGDERAEDQPVFLTVSPDNPNGAQIRFIVDGAEPPADLTIYERIVLMFDGLDEQAVAVARSHWKGLKAAGHALTYYQQRNDGGWERAA
ncbi:DNA polymerase III subunit chi [Oricola sp.]|uniref:DNA polymerase III subunit chi n=1 Tax=Oricola sp. TaxID=1979950 RepID=UPI000C96DAA4|nr:DNA polymerase III subunit chi [Ahrensia sp.]|tara:strand:+ start:7772 stop:8224 length:453 start_codon:yes stop_codon:yes gene_type:complete